MTSHLTINFYFELLILIIAMGLMAYVLIQNSKLLKILQGSKIEAQWKQARIIIISISLLFFFFALTRILATISKSGGSDTIFGSAAWYNLGIEVLII